jgi:hypothetical protein
MLIAIVLANWLVGWAVLIWAGRQLGRYWHNEQAGWVLPLVLGVLGFLIFAAGSHPATQPERVPRPREIGG